MLFAFTPTAVPTFVTLPVETLVHEPPVLPVIVVSLVLSVYTLGKTSDGYWLGVATQLIET